MTTNRPPERVWLFFGLAYSFSWLFWIPNALAAQGWPILPALTSFLAGPFNPAAFGPLVGALALAIWFDGWRGASALLRRGLNYRFGWQWLLTIFVLPITIFSGAIVVAGFISARPLDRSAISDPLYALIAIFVILLTNGPLQLDCSTIDDHRSGEHRMDDRSP